MESKLNVCNWFYQFYVVCGIRMTLKSIQFDLMQSSKALWNIFCIYNDLRSKNVRLRHTYLLKQFCFQIIRDNPHISTYSGSVVRAPAHLHGSFIPAAASYAER